jgi:hypothetical protein
VAVATALALHNLVVVVQQTRVSLAVMVGKTLAHTVLVVVVAVQALSACPQMAQLAALAVLVCK